MIRRCTVICLLSLGCQSIVELDPQEPTDGTRTAIWVGQSGEANELFAAPFDPGARLTFSGKETKLWVLYYQRTLEQLFLEPGAVRQAEDESSRQLPLFDQAFSYAEDGSSQPVVGFPEELRGIRLPAPTFFECVGMDGCYIERDEEEECVVPCPRAAVTIQPLQSPALPELTPCINGFTEEEEDEGITVCVPPAKVECAADEAQWIGTSSCSKIGTPCPVGDWPSDLPGGTLVFVDASAMSGGDGTQARPYRTLVEALGPGATIVLAKGTYTEPVLINVPVTIIGTCVAETMIQTDAVSLDLTAQVTLRNLTVFGRTAVRVRSASAELESVVLNAAGTALMVEDGRVEGRNFSCREGASGVSALRSEVVLERSFISGTRIGVNAKEEGARVSLRDFVVREVSNPVFVGDRAVVVLQRGLVEGGLSYVLHAEREGSLTATDLVIGAANDQGAAIDVKDAYLELSRATISSTNSQALYAGMGSEVNLTDVVVRDVGETAVTVGNGASTIERVAVLRGRRHAFWLRGTQAAVSDVVVAGIADVEEGGGVYGYGVVFRNGLDEMITSAGTLNRVRISGCDAAGLWVSHDSVITASDIEINDSRTGILLPDNTSFEANRVVIAAARGAGICLQSDSHITLKDLIVHGTRGMEHGSKCLYTPGAGIYLGIVAGADLSRFWLKDNKESGISSCTASLTASEGVISQNVSGLLMPAGIIPERLVDVRFLNNDSSVVSSATGFDSHNNPICR